MDASRCVTRLPLARDHADAIFGGSRSPGQATVPRLIRAFRNDFPACASGARCAYAAATCAFGVWGKGLPEAPMFKLEVCDE